MGMSSLAIRQSIRSIDDCAVGLLKIVIDMMSCDCFDVLIMIQMIHAVYSKESFMVAFHHID